MSIVVKDVTKKYGNQAALNKVSFSINSGEIVGFLGPNGAGKSTMMKILTCYLEKTEGSVLVNQYDVDKNPQQIKSIVGYLPESNPLYKEMYVKEYLLFIAGLYKIKRKKEAVSSIIEKVGLQLEQHKTIGALSKGYKQRVGLAQALIHNPKVLILDEATTGLDPNQIVEIRNLIKEVGKEKTVLMSTHIMQEVEAICDRVIIINRGNIVADGNVPDVKKMVQSKQSIVVEFRESIDSALINDLNGIDEVIMISPNKFKVVASSSSDIRERIFQLAISKNWNIISLVEEETKLEEVFKSLTSN